MVALRALAGCSDEILDVNVVRIFRYGGFKGGFAEASFWGLKGGLQCVNAAENTEEESL